MFRTFGLVRGGLRSGVRVPFRVALWPKDCRYPCICSKPGAADGIDCEAMCQAAHGLPKVHVKCSDVFGWGVYFGSGLSTQSIPFRLGKFALGDRRSGTGPAVFFTNPCSFPHWPMCYPSTSWEGKNSTLEVYIHLASQKSVPVENCGKKTAQTVAFEPAPRKRHLVWTIPHWNDRVLFNHNLK